MSLATRSRRRVESALERLEAGYGVERKHRPTSHVPRGAYERTVDRFEAGTVGGAGAWVAADDGAVLLVREAPDGPWSEPSGKQEPGERLTETARREVREQAGVECEPWTVALAQVVRVRDADRPDRPTVHRLVVIFGAAYLDGDPRPASSEVAAAEWFREHPDDLLREALSDLPIPVRAD